MMAQYTLWIGNKNYSSWSLRGWLMCKLAGIAFDEVLVRLDEGDRWTRFRQFAPSGRVPTLKLGDLVVWDTMAIGEYLAERYPERKLWPADARARAIARAVSAEMHSGFAPLRSQLPMNMHRTKAPPQWDADAQRDIDRVQELWRDCRKSYGAGGPYLFGHLTLADCFYAPVVSRFTTYRVPMDGVASAYCEAMWEWPALEAWREAALEEPWLIARDEAI
jgi:glutathione S-transferase